MKRVLKLFLFIFMFCCFTNVMFAKTIKDVACYYHITNSAGEFMTDVNVQVIGYNGGSGGSVKVEYRDINGSPVEYKTPTKDWQNFEKIEANYNVTLNLGDLKSNNFISSYKKISACPTIRGEIGVAGEMEVIHIITDNGDPQATVWEIKPYSEMLKGDEGGWQKKEDFYRDEETGETTVKDDLVCTYKMYFDRYSISTDVEFITKYNAADNSKKSYIFKVGDINTAFTDLNFDVVLDLRQSGREMVHVTSDQLKKIFLDECLPGEKVFHYYDISREGYIITTDEQEASDNGTAGRYDDGAGSNDGQAGGSNTDVNVNINQPDLDIYGGSMTCVQLLGPGLTKILNFAIDSIRIIGVIASIVMAMVTLIPAVNKGDQGELNNAIRKCIWIAVVLCIIVLFPLIVRVIGKLFGFDISCIF